MDIGANANELNKYVIHGTFIVFELCKCALKHLSLLIFYWTTDNETTHCD